jgi:hypothetical protein
MVGAAATAAAIIAPGGCSSLCNDGGASTRVTYNRQAALTYARDRWSRVSGDNYVGLKASPPYRQVPSGTVFVRKVPGDPGTEVARLPNGEEISIDLLEDCAHFVSCCIGKPPNGGGGGLPIGSDFPNALYGRPAARSLFAALQQNGLITLVDGERIDASTAASRLNAGQLQAADLIFYYFSDGGVQQRDPGHVGIYLADSQKRIACHTYCRADQSNDYDQSWNSVRGAYAYTLAKVN